MTVAGTWSQHQYQRHPTLDCRRSPGHGLSPVTASLKILNASLRGNPHVLLGFRMEGIASIYFSFRLLYPPILWKPAADFSVKRKWARSGERKKKIKGWFISCFFNLLIPTKANDPSVMTTVWKVSVYITALSPPEKRNSRISGHVQRTCLLDKRNAPWLSPKQIYVMNVEILDYLQMSKS